MADTPNSAARVFFRRFFMSVGVVATVSFVAMLFTVARLFHPGPATMPDKILLSYNFKSSLPEVAEKPSLTNLSLRGGPLFRDIAQALTDAAKDARVKGFVARIDGAHLAVAQNQELRDAIRRFRRAGKFAYVFADSFGGGGPGMGDYYLASAFDGVWLQPVGIVAMNGVGAEVPFAKDFLDKVGVEAQFSHKGIYKSMPESLTRTGMSEPHREMMTALVSDLSRQMTAGIASGRGLSPEAVRALIDRSPLTGAEAVRAKLVDRIGYADEMLDLAMKKAGVDDDGVVTLADYDSSSAPAGKNKKAADGDKKIALIYGVGDITASGRGGMAADDLVPAFRDAMKDKDVAAVVFRIDSPGGSPEAAESIRRAVVRMRKEGRPVVVSMGGYAASGGYWIAAGADRIVAEPGTITGSIGVFGGKIVLAGLWRKIGISWDGVASGKNALMWSMNRPFTGDEMARFDAMLSGIYDAFIARVAEGRHMSKEKTEAVAEGRVWTGAQAKDRGLVDELGGLDIAVKRAKELAKIDPASDIPLVEFPEKKSPLEMLSSLGKGGEDDVSILPFGADAVMKAATDRLRAQGAVLRMPYVIVN